MSASSSVEVRAPSAAERDALFAWLNTGLRRGAWRRLEREFPTVAQCGPLSGHVVALQEERFAAHALAHTARLRAGPHRFDVGMIGMVYTDPARRGAGLARRCIDSALAEIRRRGAGLCLLWSELDDFYRRLGFARAGREWFFWLEREALAARVAASDPTPLSVGAPGPHDWPALEALYAGHPARAERPPGALQTLATGPACSVAVARDAVGVAAYAARGRGDDFPDIVHEWAGDPSAVMACLASLAAGRDWLGLLCPPTARAMLATLSAGGFRRFRNDLAWCRVVDAALLWHQLAERAAPLRALDVSGAGDHIACRAAGGEVVLDAAAFLAWLLDGAEPLALVQILAADERNALREVLPVPLYLWGFDSV